MRRSLTALFAILALCCASARAQWDELHFVDPHLNWRTLETPHFLVHFGVQNRSQAQVVAGIAERVYARTTALLDWEPRQRTHLVLMDSADFANGFATPLPFDLTGIFLSPPDEGELLQNRDWLELVLSHEFFHVVHLDKATGSPLHLRDVLGRLFPFFPNALEPTWIIEGLAVNQESEAARSYGRLGNSYYEGMMRAEVDRGLRSLREVNADGRGFPLNRMYLYGSYFFAFLRERYGDHSVRAFIDNYSGNILPFKVQSNPVAVTGKPMDALWVEYHDWLRARFAHTDLAPVAGNVVLRAFSITSPMLTPRGERWYVQSDGYTRPQIVRQPADGKPTAVRPTESDTRLAPADDGGVLAAEQEICRNHNVLYDLNHLDARGARRPITQCERDRFAAQLANGRVAVVRVAAGDARVLALQPGSDARVLYRTLPGETVSGLAALGDRIVVTALRGGIWSLLDISDGQRRVLVADEAAKHSPRFGDSPDEMFFIADYGKRYDIWSWRRADNSLSRWTRSAYGVRDMSTPVAGEILLTTIEADGVALRTQRLTAPLEHRQASAREAAAAEPIGEASFGEDRPYSPWPSIRPTAWAPLVQIADGAVALGAVTYGTDALMLHQYVLAPMVELTQGELLGHAEYFYDGRQGFAGDRTLTVRASDTEGSRVKIKAYSVRQSGQWTSLWRALKFNQRWYWGGGAEIEEEQFHDLGFGTTRVQNERVAGLVGGFDSRRTQFLSEGPSQGQELRLFVETSQHLGADFTGNVYRADWRGHVPLGKTVLGLRWNEAYGTRDAERFELGGSKSDDYILLPQINERDFALRGYTTGTVSLMGHRARVTTLEWRAPLADIDRHLMVPPVGINRLALNLFADVGAAWEHGDTAHYRRGIGAELMSEPKVGYLFGLQFRAGVAKGLDPTGSTKIYLRAGRAF